MIFSVFQKQVITHRNALMHSKDRKLDQKCLSAYLDDFIRIMDNPALASKESAQQREDLEKVLYGTIESCIDSNIIQS